MLRPLHHASIGVWVHSSIQALSIALEKLKMVMFGELVFRTFVCLVLLQVRVAVVGGGTGEVLTAAGLQPEFTATKVRKC